MPAWTPAEAAGAGRLEHKVALVTGAARGLGRACAIAFAREGADLVLTDIGADLPGVPYPLGTESQLAHTASQCRAHGAETVSETADVRDATALTRVRAAALERYGRVDIVVNSAGIAAPSGRPVHEITEVEWRLMLDTDLTGAWQVMRLFTPLLLDNGAGSVINIASTAGLLGYRYFAGYVAAKHGLVGLTKAAALDYAPLGIRCNAVCPGNVRDDPAGEGRMLAEIARSLALPAAEHEPAFLSGQPMNVLVDPEDVAAAALWLASDESRHVTGTVITVDAGYTAR